MSKSEKEFAEEGYWDVMILGAGVSGLGAALALAQQGYRCLVLEREQGPALATSDNTFRIMHGGFRYLQKLDFPRIIESVRDQNFLFKNFPTLVQPFDCLMPLNRFGLKSRYPLMCAALVYNLLCFVLTGRLGRSCVLTTNKAKQLNPLLNAAQFPFGALCWQDGRLYSNSELVKELMRELLDLGVEFRFGHKVKAVEGAPNSAIKALVENAAELKELQARVVVNTLGPRINDITKNYEKLFPNVQWARSFNLVLKNKLPTETGLGLESAEKRLFFIVPRHSSEDGEHSAVGTFNLFLGESAEQVEPSDKEIESAIYDFNRLPIDFKIKAADLIRVEHGVLPVKGENNGQIVFFGQEQIATSGNYVEVLSTKYTTFRSQGQRIAKIVSALLGRQA